jgi:hypothetical protein
MPRRLAKELMWIVNRGKIKLIRARVPARQLILVIAPTRKKTRKILITIYVI